MSESALPFLERFFSCKCLKAWFNLFKLQYCIVHIHYGFLNVLNSLLKDNQNKKVMLKNITLSSAH